MSDVSEEVGSSNNTVLPSESKDDSPAFKPTVDQRNQGPTTTPIPEAQESARKRLAFFLTYIFFAEILFAMTGTWLPCRLGLKCLSVEEMKDIMTIIFAPTVALVGSAAGFYFGNSPKH